jgi:hypothetical protein
MKRVVIFALVISIAFVKASCQNPEPTGWYAGDMHVHRSCGGSPESVPTMFGRMTPQNLAVVSQLADSGNGEVQDATSDLPLVNGDDDPISTANQLLHWDTEWHWDATYTQYPHQALGGHVVNLGLSSGQQLWQEYTFPILDWAHQHNGIAGFAHLQYLDGNGLPSSLTCCTPIEFPVEVALGAADFISEDVLDVNQPGTGTSMYSESSIQAYYKLLNSGFRPGLAAGTDYPCNGRDNGGALGGLLTYSQVAGGQLTYRNWIQAISSGRTVVSRNGHNEFLLLTVNGTSTPGDQIQLAGAGNLPVTVQWTSTQSASGTIELVQNGTVVARQQGTAGPGAPLTLTANVNFAKSGWLAARRMGTNPMTSLYEHYVHTAAVFVAVNNAPIRASQADAQYFVTWTNGLLQNTSPGGIWNSFFPTSLAQAQARYQAANALFTQVASEAAGSAPALNSIAVTPSNQSAASGSQISFGATGLYSSGTSLNITAQVRWTSSNPAVAAISTRGLVAALSPGVTQISASLSGKTASTSLTVVPSPLTISTQSLASGIVGAAYSSAIAVTGGTPPYTWSITGGSLAAGLSLNGSTGTISGTPTAAGSFSVTIQVTDSGSPTQAATQTFPITIAAPSACPCSIWPSTAAPGIVDGGPDSAVELGVEFRSDVNGSITGIRFYKSAANTGTHVGNLWTSGGTQLATATFTGESSSGWQQVNFTTPVSVSAGTVYVASYHTTVGHYAYDQNYFATQGVDNVPLHALQNTSTTPNGVFVYGGGGFPNQTWTATNYWVDVVFGPAGPDTTPPTVQSVSPPAGTSGVNPASSISATFSEVLNASTVNGTSVQLLDPSSSPVPAAVTYNSSNSTATLTPNTSLLNSTTYTAVVKGGIIKDLAGNALVSNYTWSFTTAAPPPPPPTEGPGGPILVVSSSTNPFSRYYAEILRNEGFNEFTAMDITLVSASTLNSYDVVILGNFTLTAAQASMFTSWVNNGGNLIAMRPDKQLASLLGLTNAGSVLSEGYLLINTASGPGSGLVSETVQFHGNADLYNLSNATSLATLYSNATTPTANPAVTLNQAGLGQAAAFTYDLAQSVIYTRQGNPAWSGEARDGEGGPIRSDDLYFGAASFDPEPDYVDRNKIAIPQADEQQRLLANLIIQMNLVKLPLPRFWYFPGSFMAAVVLTGDDHGSMYSGGATAPRFDHYISLSPAGCSVTNWQCVRSTSYLIAPSIASNPLTNAQAASYLAQGFEIGAHIDSVPDCSNWTTSQLASFYSSQLSSFQSAYPSVPQQKTHRMHCIGWSDYDSQPQIELQNQIRLDTNYYYWPPAWVNDTPGLFTGSGMPMRFTTRNGTMLDIYQATTQMTDESGQTYPFHIDTLLDNALGATAYYGYFTANMHNDVAASDGADAIIASAQSRGVPVISSAQLLTWLDGRNGSSFSSLVWNGSTLTFGIAVGSGANGLQAMLPASSGTNTLSSITLGGNPVAFTIKTIKGVSYAVFPALVGTYQATYAAGLGVTASSVSMNPSSVVGGASSTGTVSLSGPAPSGGAQITLSTSDTTDTTLPTPTVTVPQGSTSTTFTVNTNAVIATANAVISATYGNTVSAKLTVTPAPAVASLALNPTTVTGGTSSTATVTLSQPAPAGTVITLSSSNTAAASVPSSITLAATSTTATFTVTSFAVSSAASVTISATYKATASAVLTVNPPLPKSVALSPASVTGGKTSAGTLTLNGPAPASGATVSLSSSNTSVATVPISVTVNGGATSATFTVSTVAVSTSTSVTISATYGGASASAPLTVTAVPALSALSLSPTSLVGGSSSTGTVTLTLAAPTGGFAVALSDANSPVTTLPTSVTVAAGRTTATFTITTTPVTAQTAVVITATAGAISKSATLTVTPPALSGFSLSPTSVTGGANSTGTVTLNGRAPSNITVNLTSANPAVASVPATVTVLSGATTGTFTVATVPVTAQTAVVITASYRAVNRTATVTVNPTALSTLSLSPTSVVGTNSSTGTVTLTGNAPPNGVVVSLASSRTTAATVPGSVMVAAGSRTATFTITSYAVAANTSSTISATLGTVSRTSTLTVNAPSPTSLALNPSTVKGGNSSTATVTLNGPAPAAGIAVTLSSSNANATVPATVTVPGGSTTATFTISTRVVAANVTSSISARYNSVTRSATLTITP